MIIDFEYGQGTIKAELPDDTDVFIPGETWPDPAYSEDVYEMTRKSVLEPIGMDPISDLVKPGYRVSIVFPDRVKGGEQKDAHRKVAIGIILDELAKAGVCDKGITLICSNGLHAKNTSEQIYNILGKEIFNRFWYKGQIVNHDSEDASNLVDLGCTKRGDRVIMNRTVFESDLAVMIGHVQGNPYGGYSGGYKHCATGITHWRSIASHHVPDVMHREDFTPVSTHSLMRTKFDEIAMHMEEKMGRKFFCCDAVLDTYSRQVAVFSGYADEIQKLSWETADKRTYAPWAEKKYNVMVFGMPRFFHYGDGMGTNPIMMLQAISAQVIRHKRVLADNCVIICSSICDGWFNDELFTGYRAIYDLYQTNKHNKLPDLNKYGEYFATNEEYIRRYRYGYGFHPFHGFSMISCGHIALQNTSAIYITGAREPGFARGMGMKTAATIEEALDEAKMKYAGESPNILALPKAFKTTSMHLCMK